MIYHGGHHESFCKSTDSSNNEHDKNQTAIDQTKTDLEMRVIQLERLVSRQKVEISRLKSESRNMRNTINSFAEVMDLLRQAGLQTNEPTTKLEPLSSKEKKSENSRRVEDAKEFEYFADNKSFGVAPSSMTDAADAAGAAILSAVLDGKRRMLVDVRDAELSRDTETLVQFLELAILPVAAGVEGMPSQRNRVKIVFPTVSQLLDYRKTMALAAPEVVALSTLGFDAVEDRDNLVVILVPSPDDVDGMTKLLNLLKENESQPIVLLNYHMVPPLGSIAQFNYEPVYYLRLLTVQYMAGDDQEGVLESLVDVGATTNEQQDDDNFYELDKSNVSSTAENQDLLKEDAELEAAMEHAHETGVHQGITRAMVIRAYPR